MDSPTQWSMPLKLYFYKITILFFMLPLNTFAFEWLPEFQSLTEEEQSTIETSLSLDPEYQSDVLAYTKPFEWEYLWLSHQNAFDLSVGSVSAQHFMIDNRLKVRTFLTDHLEFRFTYFAERNRERDSSHAILELVVWPWKKWGISFYGEPSLFKRENDTGIALLYQPHEKHEIRLFQTFVDVTRLKRNDRSDTYIEPFVPKSRGMVGRIWSEKEKGEFLEYAFRHESETRWSFPDEGYEYDYWKVFASLFFSYQIQPKTQFNWRAQFDRRLETQYPTSSSSSISNESWETKRFFLLTQIVLSDLGPSQNWKLTGGVEYAYRDWTSLSGDVVRKDLLPHFWFHFPVFGKGPTRDELGVGYDLTYHRASGDIGLRHPSDQDLTYEHRLNLSYEFYFKQNASIRLMITGDLDKMFTRESWQGGNGQLRLYF